MVMTASSTSSILMGSMLEAPRDSAGVGGGVVDHGFFAFFKEGSPREEPDVFLKVDLINFSEGLIVVT